MTVKYLGDHSHSNIHGLQSVLTFDEFFHAATQTRYWQMLLGPTRAELKSILVESFSTPSRLRGFVRDHLTTHVDYERSGLKHEENVGELADTLDSAGLMDTFLKEVQREFQGDVPKRSAQIARILRELQS